MSHITNKIYVEALQKIEQDSFDFDKFSIQDLANSSDFTKDEMAKIINLAIAYGKQEVKREVTKQAENMLYWVNKS